MLVFFSCVFGFIKLFDDNDKPILALSNVLDIAQKIRKSNKPLDNKANIKEYMLANWCHTKNGSFYPPGKERDEFDIPESLSKKHADILYNNFRKLGMIDAFEPQIDQDLRYIVFWAGYYPRAVDKFEIAKQFFKKAHGQNAKIIILTGDREVERLKGHKKPLDYGVPDNVHTEKDIGYFLAKQDENLPVIVIHSSKKGRAHTPDYAKDLKNWLALQKDTRGGTIVVVIRQPLSQNVLAVFTALFKNTPYKINVLAAPPPFQGASQDSILEATRRMLPHTPAKLTKQSISICMDTLARTMSLMDMTF